jgi:hypothetical protein
VINAFNKVPISFTCPAHQCVYVHVKWTHACCLCEIQNRTTA